jgi:hypothetical protein
MSEDTKTTLPAAPRITIDYAGQTYKDRLRGDDLDPQRLEAAREIAAACAGLYLRAGRSTPMASMVQHELAATLRRLADLG